MGSFHVKRAAGSQSNLLIFVKTKQEMDSADAIPKNLFLLLWTLVDSTPSVSQAINFAG